MAASGPECVKTPGQTLAMISENFIAREPMKRFIQGEHRGQNTLLPESLDDYVSDTNPVRMVDVFVDELNLAKLGFDGVIPAETCIPPCDPAEDLYLRLPQPHSVEPTP